jgi:glycosyltransferase involved in cell wall biosynthesis
VDNSSLLASVLIPAYNAENTIVDAVQSVLIQTHTNFEIIVVDDGSQDATLELLKGIQDSRLRILEFPENRGLIDALNAGLELCKGKYVFRLDADDICKPSRIQEQICFLESNPEVGLLGTAFESIDSKGTTTLVRYASSHDTIAFKHLYQIHLCHPTVAIRKSVLIEQNLKYNIEYKHAEDYGLFNQLLKVTRASNLPSVLLTKVNALQTVSNRYSEIQETNSQRAKMELFEWLHVKITPELLQEYRKLNHQDYTNITIPAIKLGKMLLQLIRGNKKRGFIEHRFLVNEIQRLWFHLCLNKRKPLAYLAIEIQIRWNF